MTAHPESVVGVLRYLIDSDMRLIAVGDASYEGRATAFATEHAPALLAALEKVWAQANKTMTCPVRTAADQANYFYASRIKDDLAPLFLAPETPSHD